MSLGPYIRGRDDGDRPVGIHLDAHVRAKSSGLHTRIQPAERAAERVEQRTPAIGRRGMREVGPPATADVAVERELGDREDRAADVRDAVVQSPAIVLEQAKLDDLPRKPLAVLRAVAGA